MDNEETKKRIEKAANRLRDNLQNLIESEYLTDMEALLATHTLLLTLEKWLVTEWETIGKRDEAERLCLDVRTHTLEQFAKVMRPDFMKNVRDTDPPVRPADRDWMERAFRKASEK